MTSLGTYIKQRRKDRGLEQAELAELLRTGIETAERNLKVVATLEAMGQCSPHHLRRLIDVLHLEPDMLVRCAREDEARALLQFWEWSMKDDPAEINVNVMKWVSRTSEIDPDATQEEMIAKAVATSLEYPHRPVMLRINRQFRLRFVDGRLDGWVVVTAEYDDPHHFGYVARSSRAWAGKVRDAVEAYETASQQGR